MQLEFPVEQVHHFTDELARRGLLEVPTGTPFDGLLDEHAPSGPRRVLFACLQRDGRMLGILSLHQHAREPRFSEQALRLADGFAHQAAIALANARLVEDLTEANRVKSEFLSTMSHELRTPLNVIIGFAEIGRDGTGTEEPEACFAKIEEAGRELFNLIEDTLQIGRFESGRDEVRLEQVALPALWRSLGEACGRLPRRTTVSLDWNEAMPIAGLVSDPRKLGIVVRNLVGNALKFTERGHVRASAQCEGEHLVIEVRDTGIGIAPEDQAVVFEKFRQVDGSDSRRFGGAGLGLYIARCYIEQLGGTVTLTSTPGVGSTFTVRLPLRDVQSPPAPTAA
jgi:signal transduction histidine kinase